MNYNHPWMSEGWTTDPRERVGFWQTMWNLIIGSSPLFAAAAVLYWVLS